MPLSKSDLEILACIFVVPKNGKKEEVERHIIKSSNCPLSYRVPVAGKRPNILARSEARPPCGTSKNNHNTSNSENGAAVVTTSTAMTTMPTTSARPNIPNLTGVFSATSGDQIGGRRANASMYNSLSQQLDTAVEGVVPDLVVLSATTGAPRGASISKSKQVRLTCYELLQGYEFKDGENAFNEPLNEPLGDEKYVLFSSALLSKGNDDPVLKFATPPVITAKDRAEVSGGDVQIHLRCLRVDVDKPREEWEQAWPFPALCRVNGHSVTLNQAQRYTNGRLAGRDAATNVSAYLSTYFSNGVKCMNKVTLHRKVTNALAAWGQFVLFAQEVIVHSHETMMENVKTKSEKYWQKYRTTLEGKGELSDKATNFDMARQGVLQFMNDPDGVTVSSMKMSLRCPLALTRIDIPVKGRQCQHVQCFDLGTFLEYARRSSKFECPVCNKATAYPSDLVISPYIEHALEQYKDCDEVEIVKSGEMVAVERSCGTETNLCCLL